jgi:DMSO reductase family type II enzyme heme b subunit
MSMILDAKHSTAVLDDLLAPASPQWQDIPAMTLGLIPTALDRQPSAYVQTSWAGKPRGEIPSIQVQTLQAGDGLAIRLEWAALEPSRSINDINVYADACAILFPENGKQADLETMGSEQEPVIAWHWRAGTEEPFAITAKGIGTVTRHKEHQVRARSRWTDGKWQVVFTRALQGEDISLNHGMTLPVAFAVWSGVVAERGGLKSHTPEFHQLKVS